MKFFLKLLFFIAFFTASLQPAACHVAGQPDTVLVSQLEIVEVQIDNTIRTRQPKVKVFFSYINSHKNTPDTALYAQACQDIAGPGKSLQGEQAMPMPAEQTMETIRKICSFLI